MNETVFDHLRQRGHDEDYQPFLAGFSPTAAAPGSEEKLEVLRIRVERGQPLWHELDNDRYDATTRRSPVQPLAIAKFAAIRRLGLMTSGKKHLAE